MVKKIHFSRCDGNYSVILFLTALLFFIFSLTALRPDAQAESVFKIGPESNWHYLESDNTPSEKWMHSGFDSSTWNQTAPNRFFDNHFSNDIDQDWDLYLRHQFWVKDPGEIKKLKLTIASNIAFKAYLNGVEIIRSNVTIGTTGKLNTGKSKQEVIDISGFIGELLPGLNVFSAQYKKIAAVSTDSVFCPTLEASK